MDSIQWLERAHHMILFARNQTYRPTDLKRMIERDRLLFEGWTHDAAIIPCEFYPYWRHRFQRQKIRLRERFRRWQGNGFISHCDALLALIKANGPVRSRDLERPARRGPQQMWQWHDGKAALEFLWRTGELAISGRDGFQKIYDLSERVIPAVHLASRCDHNAFIDWACFGALERLGFGSAADIARYWDLLSIREVRDWLERQTQQRVMKINVESANHRGSKVVFARADLEQVVENFSGLPPRLRALSPFDPVVRDRIRAQWLFDFQYRIEIYVPRAKRKYGYYVFPLLEKDRFIGRIDMRANRQEDVLQVKKLWLEPGIKLTATRGDLLAAELVRQARHAGVKQVEWLA